MGINIHLYFFYGCHIWSLARCMYQIWIWHASLWFWSFATFPAEKSFHSFPNANLFTFLGTRSCATIKYCIFCIFVWHAMWGTSSCVKTSLTTIYAIMTMDCCINACINTSFLFIFFHLRSLTWTFPTQTANHRPTWFPRCFNENFKGSKPNIQILKPKSKNWRSPQLIKIVSTN